MAEESPTTLETTAHAGKSAGSIGAAGGEKIGRAAGTLVGWGAGAALGAVGGLLAGSATAAYRKARKRDRGGKH